MPGRVSQPSALASRSSSTAKSSVKKRSRKRVLDAFAIASHEVDDSSKIRRSRLGQAEEDPRDRKRRRARLLEEEGEEGDDDDADSEDGDIASARRQKRQKRRASVAESDEGSDSEGNTWTMGHVDQDDDSEIDSDEAFSEGDEVRFAHLTFGGSKVNRERRAARRKIHKRGAMDLDEDELGEESDDESLGDEAVDLAQMLDDYSEEDDLNDVGDSTAAVGAVEGGPEEGSIDDEDDEDDEAEFSDSSLEDDDEQNTSKLGRLQNLVSSLHPQSAEEKSRGPSSYESMVPSAAGIRNIEKFDIRAILEASGDAKLAKSSKSVGVIPSKVVKKDRKLAPALPKRQREKLDRIAANEKAKETLDRWKDSVKQMRRAEHLTFPLQDPGTKAAHDTGYLLPTITGQPVNSLESTINSILHESGLGTNESKEQPFDALPENNQASVEDVMAKRAELRRARDLIFREEQRAKRIKKIKSKSYRRVHRKERERLAALDKDAFEEEFGEMDEEEREAHDRQRAQERMGAKHRDSKWAKQMKKSGRSIWDDDAKAGVSDMARRNEELRRRIAGKETGGDSADESSSSSDDDGPSDEDEPTFQLRQLRQKLAKLDDEDDHTEQSGLAGMKFMQKAEAHRKAQNDDDIRRMVKEMNDEQSDQESSDQQDQDIGRKLFGPTSAKKVAERRQGQRQEFEELEDSAAEEEEGSEAFDAVPLVDPSLISNQVESEPQRHKSTNTIGHLAKHNQKQGEQRSESRKADQEKSMPSTDAEMSIGERHSAPNTDGWITVTYDKDSEASQTSDVESEVSQAEILRKAFAGDDVEADFEEEKKAIIVDEDDKVIDNTLPGWGSWVGEGISKREQKRNKGKVLVKQTGIRPQDRKDHGLKGVIINQKRLKKNISYMANALPFPFTSQAEYDRSIRMPIGKEWNVNRTYNENTKPRVIVKPGQVVRPMTKPLI